MPINAATKKAARAYAAEYGVSYTAALRAVSEPQVETTAVPVTLTFLGDGAPSPVTLDASPWMRHVDFRDLEWLRENDWAYDGRRLLEGLMRDVLATASKEMADPVLASIADWLKTNTAHWTSTFELPAENEEGVETHADFGEEEPLVARFDAEAVNRWFGANRPRRPTTLSDYVTPAEQRTWMQRFAPGHLDCVMGRHHFDASPSPYMGECIWCGALMLVRRDSNGDEHNQVVDEETYFAECIATEAYCNWAPPTKGLRGKTQSEWLRLSSNLW